MVGYYCSEYGKISSNLKGLAIALVGALIAKYLHIPLPWLLGPLLTALLFGSVGHPPVIPSGDAWAGHYGMALGYTALVGSGSILGFYSHRFGMVTCWGTLLAGLQYRVNALLGNCMVFFCDW